MRWAAHDPSNELKTFHMLNRSKSYEDYLEALRFYDCPGQNLVFADKSGDIAIWHNGKFPLRWKGQGRYLLDGSNPDDEWKDWVPREHNPHVKNPDRGFVSSANQIPADSDYPYYLGWDYVSFERGTRINELLSAMKDITPEDMIEMQSDVMNLRARMLLPRLLDILKAKSLTPEEMQSYEELKNWNSTQKSMRSHFFIYGNIKERQDMENKYFIDLEALVVHAPVNVPVKKQIKKEFLSVWYKQISFQEKIEFRGFEFAADSIFVAVEYIVGIAALVSGDIELALKLHNNLNNNPYFQKFTPLPPNLKHVKEELKNLLTEENYLLARYYYKQNNLEKCYNCLNQSFLIQQSYGALLLRSIIEFCNENNPEKALNTIYESKKLAKNDGTWRYSEGFLLMYLEKYDKAVKVYKKIIENSYPGEESTLKEVYEFNDNILKNNPEKVQLFFVLGYLKYKKDSNYPEAYDYFEEFLSKANNKYDFLIEKAISYKAELEQKMKI